MLLEFKMKNFKSFKEEMCFNMVPSKIKDMEYSVLQKSVGSKNIKALSSSAIYGPNSAGKTNIISGMEVLRSIILQGNILNKNDVNTSNICVSNLELIPNVENVKSEPVSFYIKFVANDMVIQFSLSLNLGKFLDVDYDREIVSEELIINNNLIYRRNKDLEIGKLNSIKEYLIEGFSKEVADKISKTNLDKKELFFNGMFKSLYSKKLFDIIYDWFKNNYIIVYRSDRIHFRPVISTENENEKYYNDELLNMATKNFGLTAQSVLYPINKDEKNIKPLSYIKCNDKVNIIPAEIFESFGTIRFLDIFPLILTAINTGSILVIDELDASIHPMAIMNIISIFHNDEINKLGAQLIFNTHNPIFLNNAILRRDEIKFVEKEEKTSVVYSLADFGTNGSNGVRNTEDYMKNYFVSKYGAIKNVDFSEIFLDKEGSEI